MKNFSDSSFLYSPFRFIGFRENWIPTAFTPSFGSYLSVNSNLTRILSTNAFDTSTIEPNHVTKHIRFLRDLLFNDIETDPLLVANPKTQVKGILDLRICEISIFLEIPGYYSVLY
ncbi:hypothetical protein I4U23_015116 [Adineta vaga]|nr:hypothetical protein I4U23_015116 [Adineta vaga]